MFHTTSVENGEKIMSGGFKIPARTGAFGRGVNLSPDLAHTLMYAPKRNACTLVCKVVVGRMHANVSRVRPGREDTVPDYVRPKRGHDAMYGAGGLIVVVPCAARVLPVEMIVHMRAS